MMAVNAWIIHKVFHHGKEQIDLIRFKRAVCTMFKFGRCREKSGEERNSPGLTTTLMFDERKKTTLLQNERRCQRKLCSKKLRTYFVKCDVTL